MVSTESSTKYWQDLETLTHSIILADFSCVFPAIFNINGNRLVLDGGSAHELVSLKIREKGTASPVNGPWF